MNISALFIERPVATSLLAVAALLTGLLGYLFLPVSALPQVDFPTIQVTTQLPGADPDTMAMLVTAPLERQLGQIPSLQRMSSSSGFGLSQITLQFVLDRDIDGAAQDVQAAINAANSTLPKNLPYPPVYSKVNPAASAIVTLALTSDTVSIRQLADLGDTLIAQRLSQLTGVGHVGIQGNMRPAIRIQADFARLANYGLGLEDLRTAISNSNVAGAKGSLDGPQQSYTLASNDQLTSADTYKEVVVTYHNNAPVFVTDVADVVEGLENDKVAGWHQGKPAVVIDVQRQPGANIVETVARVKAELTRLQQILPSGVSMTIVHDGTETIRASIADVQFTLVVSIVLVVIVVLFFLRTVRATIVAGVALPLSLIATFAVMWLSGFSLDNLSLMALTIGTGFVIDDAIVMIENIHRYIEDGETPLAAALKGAKEIGFTVVSLTISLIAVFIPLLFMTGIVGRMFREFALTLTVAVVVSALVSLTLTPMMCGHLLRAAKIGETGHAASGLTGRIDRFTDWVLGGYHKSLLVVLRHQTLMLILSTVIMAATIWLYIVIPKGFLPAEDTGLITAIVEASPTVSFDEMGRLQSKIVETIRADPDVADVVSVTGVSILNATPNAGHLTIVLRPRESGRANAAEIIDRLRTKFAQNSDAVLYFQNVQDIQITTQASRAQYQYTLTGTSLTDVMQWTDKLVQKLRESPILREVGSEAQEGGLQVFVNVNREKAGRLGVSMQNVNDTLYDAFGQRQVSTIYAQANQYRVIIEAKPQYQNDPRVLDRLYVLAGASNTNTNASSNATGTVTTASGFSTTNQVPLSTFASLERKTAPLSISHIAQFPAVTVSFNLTRDASLSDAVAVVEAARSAIGMPDSISATYTGDAAEFQSSLAGEPWLILAAAVTIYIVLGVLYESAIHPITIMSTLPSAGVGALVAMMIFHMDLSLIGLIGIILLMGIVKKNAIMMIDFALEAERVEGLSPYDSIVKASLLRFRPIMMTTLAALFGALPLALSTGTGSELRNPLGISIIGGLLFSQLITIYSTPVIYLTMERIRLFLTGRHKQQSLDASLVAPFEAPQHSKAAE
ncbi:efflux RND transporter permease subunit [Beijerinckia indica]|uniref:Acriflavin resistance protein n=1 Tax=Beijerinckia indica subsp. indica (strain ATCC 9039 / DSM 1715 / NCIMB 8712) TaxID=395963 RepID=B2IKV1_BEII9|nr:efflux RND transporter permease subunit [Beijerinckia indica]ACB96491.1 acriflavin resistance protein [Beijerinckia indica subsp. indica ATCC 9039]